VINDKVANDAKYLEQMEVAAEKKKILHQMILFVAFVIPLFA
jgi:hypothetical protein